MSQLFLIRISVFGPVNSIQELEQFLVDQWREMEKGNGILVGFSRVPKRMPIAKKNSAGGGVRVVYDFKADGPKPYTFVIALSKKFPVLRIALVTADASGHEWLALVMAVCNGAFACARYRRGVDGCPRGFSDWALLCFLYGKVPALGGLISPEGQIDLQSGYAQFRDIEMGVVG